ncbi:MAG: cysteine desulfurase family protein [Candidatus Colwellbacteria bacterium]|nr:cysteine desulfurase family protein [Candidatus Colwellbacteria bacterium]
MRTLYFDHASTTPVDNRVRKAMADVPQGNMSSIHSLGRDAAAAADTSREILASVIGTDIRSVIFTGSATEANNMAVRGAFKAFYRSFRSEAMIPPRIIISGIEHDSLIHTVADLSEEGAEVIVVPAGRDGLVCAEDVISKIDDRTIFVSVMAANNETGAIQEVARIGNAVREIREKRNADMNREFPYPIFHTDAVQYLRYFPTSLDTLQADMLTLSAHKIGGPKGIGALVARNIGKYDIRKTIYPIVTGGGQEYGMRAGTENTEAIVGFGLALSIAEKGREKNFRKVKEVKEIFWDGFKKAFPRALLNGPIGKGGEKRLSPHILNIWIPGNYSADILMKADMAGVAISYGSACGAKSFKPSHVLSAMGLAEKRIKESIRISFGPENTIAEAREGVKRLKRALS